MGTQAAPLAAAISNPTTAVARERAMSLVLIILVVLILVGGLGGGYYGYRGGYYGPACMAASASW